MADEIRIGAQGLPPEEARKLPYLLKWVLVKGVNVVRLVGEDEPLDFLLLDVAQSGSSRAGLFREGDPNRVIPVAQKEAALPAGRSGLTYPLRVVDLQRWLQRAVSLPPATPVPLEGDAAEPAEVDNPAPGPAAENVDRLVEALRNRETGSDLRLEGADGFPIVVSPEQGYATTYSPRDRAWLESDFSRAQWKAVPGGITDEGAAWQPLTQLVWLLAYYGARDGLLPRIPRDRRFALQEWPDYQVIPMAANNLKVWAYLKWNAADTATIAREAGGDRGQVIGSLNAGFLCGQVRVAEEEPLPGEGSGQGPDSGILGRIRERLGL